MKTWSNLGVPSTEAPTGNLVWMDQVNGNDSLAVRGRMSIPFRTLTAAKNAAKAGDTIMVMPGTYAERGLAKNGVNWHFLTGATVNFDGTGAISLFDTASVGSACSFKITGTGVFNLTTDTGANSAFNLAYSGDDVMIECDKITCSRGPAVSSSGSLRLRCNSLSSSLAETVYLASGTNRLIVSEITSSGGHAIRIVGGTNDVDALRISSSGGNGVYVTAGTTHLRAFEISSSGGYGLEFAGPYDPTVIVHGARIFSTVYGCYAVWISEGSSGLKLSSCTLIGGPSAAPIVAASAFTVQIHGACTANYPVGGNISTIPLTQNPNMYSYHSSIS
jgi:hypothetical protein